MIKSSQIVNAVQGLPFMGNPKQIVIHDLNRTLANYNEASFNMAKDDMKQFCKLSNHRVVVSGLNICTVTS